MFSNKTFFSGARVLLRSRRPASFPGGQLSSHQQQILAGCLVLSCLPVDALLQLLSHETAEAQVPTVLNALFLLSTKSIYYLLQKPRKILPTIDGGQFPIEWYDPEDRGLEAVSKGNTKPICFFVPALGDTAHSSSFRTMVPIAYKAGYQPVVLNYRGMTSVPLLNPVRKL